jgi:hypothetical protein
MTKPFWEDDPETRAVFERQALEAAMSEIEQRGGLPAELKRRAWRRRLAEAMRDGRDLEGESAVHDAYKENAAELGIVGKAGSRPEPVPDGIVKAAGRWLRAVAAGGKEPSLGEMKQAAEADGRPTISRPAIRKWKEGGRWSEACALAWAECFDEQRQERRQQEYDALFDAITQPKKDDAL